MFKEKTILITGGSSGLGLEMAHALIKRGSNLILLARNPEKLELAKKAVMKSNPNGKVIIVSADISQQGILKEKLSEVLKAFPTLDFVINNAGIIKEGYFEKLSMEDFKQTFDANYFGCLSVIQITLPYLKKSKGRLINIASIAGLTGAFGSSAYCSSKYALIGLTETLRYELKPQGVSVQMVCPPEFISPMVEELNTYRTPENIAHTHMIPQIPMKVLVKDIIQGIEKNKFQIIPGFRTRLMMQGVVHFPSISRLLSDVMIKRFYVGPN